MSCTSCRSPNSSKRIHFHSLKAILLCLSVVGLGSAMAMAKYSNSEEMDDAASSIAQGPGEDISNSRADGGGDSWLVSSSDERESAGGANRAAENSNAKDYSSDDVRSRVPGVMFFYMDGRGQYLFQHQHWILD